MTKQTANFIVNGSRVSVTLELRPAQMTGHGRTVDLEPIPADAVELSLTGCIGGWGGGQIVATLREIGGDVPDIARLCDLWDRWHLNGLKAGTRKQNEELAGTRGAPYESQLATLRAAGLEVESGYKYGTAWLFEPVPADAVREIADILTRLNGAKFGDAEPAENLAGFAERIGITMTARPVSHNPNMENSDSMDNWECQFSRKVGRRKVTMSVPFSMGFGLNGAEPTIGRVLDTLALDASGIENSRNFAEWCQEYGYDADSRQAEKIYKTCKRQAESLRRFIGSDSDYKALLFDVERD